PLVHPAYVPLPPTSPRTCPLVPYTTLFRSANAHAQLFVKAGLERLYESMDQIRTFLQTKLAELQTRMQEAETKLMKFQAAHNLLDRKSTRLNSSHVAISYAVFCLKKKKSTN